MFLQSLLDLTDVKKILDSAENHAKSKKWDVRNE
jgi:hypothetical protein